MNTFRARIASGVRVDGMRRALLCGAALSGLAAMPTAAFAQDAAAEADTVENDQVIVVQARRQNETLQEVPVTVTAIGGETLQRFNIDQVADVTSRVPTLNVQVGGSGYPCNLAIAAPTAAATSPACGLPRMMRPPFGWILAPVT